MTLRTLLGGLFDYAGMFPPAALPFAEALRGSARLASLRRPWLVGTDLVLRLDDLERLTGAALREAGHRRPVTVCAVGVEAAHAEEGARRALAVQAREPMARVVTLEAASDDPEADAEDLAAARRRLGPAARLYVEPRWGPPLWAQRSPQAWRAVAALRTPEGDASPAGLKVRCAGPTALDLPTLAQAVAAAADARVPFKATQGLHHPLPDPRHGHAHGFLALAAAFRLRQVLGAEFAREDVAACLAETDPGAFGFLGGLRWQGHTVGAPELLAAVRAVPLAVGSCSLDEPDDDLARLFPG